MALGDDQVALLVDEEDVGAAGLLNIGARLAVEVHVLGVALGVSLHAGLEAHGVVEAGLDVAGAVGCSTVVLRDAQGHSGVAALEVGAHGGDQDAELVLVCGLDADDLARGEHEGAHVEGGAGPEGRDPVGVGGHDLLDGLDKAVLREDGHAEALGGICHALGVEVRAEAHDAAVFGGVGLEALEDLLAVVEDAGALAHDDAVVLGQEAFAPRAVFVVADVGVVGLHVAEGQIAPVDVLFGHGSHLLCSARIQLRFMVLPTHVAGLLIVCSKRLNGWEARR